MKCRLYVFYLTKQTHNKRRQQDNEKENKNTQTERKTHTIENRKKRTHKYGLNERRKNRKTKLHIFIAAYRQTIEMRASVLFCCSSACFFIHSFTVLNADLVRFATCLYSELIAIFL